MHTVTFKLISVPTTTQARLTYWCGRMYDNMEYAKYYPFHRTYATRIMEDYFAQIEQLIEASHD